MITLILAAVFACAPQWTAPVDAARADDLPRPLRKGLERIGVSGDALCALTVCVGVLAGFAGFDSLPCRGECLVTPNLPPVSPYCPGRVSRPRIREEGARVLVIFEWASGATEGKEPCAHL